MVENYAVVVRLDALADGRVKHAISDRSSEMIQHLALDRVPVVQPRRFTAARARGLAPQRGLLHFRRVEAMHAVGTSLRVEEGAFEPADRGDAHFKRIMV
jgi:hypothetical protein